MKTSSKAFYERPQTVIFEMTARKGLMVDSDFSFKFPNDSTNGFGNETKWFN